MDFPSTFTGRESWKVGMCSKIKKSEQRGLLRGTTNTQIIKGKENTRTLLTLSQTPWEVLLGSI